MDNKKLLTTKEVSEKLFIGKQTVRDWIKRGYINSIKTPTGYNKIPESEVARLLANSTKDKEGV